MRRLAVLAATVALTVPVRAGLQDQQPQTPTFRTEANYVRVDVYPTANDAPVMDLKQEDFEVFEEGVPQRVDAFEHIVIRGPQPQAPRVEPNTVAGARSMLENPRARVFVLFLDTHHVRLGSDRSIERPLINFLNRAIGPDDLVGVMTPEMSGADVAFARRTETIEGILSRFWGERDRMDLPDPVLEMYKRCFPGYESPRRDDRGIADEMIARYRERETLAALENLVRFLRTLRDERKAVLTISEGWLLYRPNAALGRPLGDQTDGRPPVGIDPTGRLVVGGQRGLVPYDDCERDRQRLAELDSVQWLQDIMQLANRANASFYPVDPRGLAVFDTEPGDPRTGRPPRGQSIMVPPSVDAAMLRGRLDALRNLAFNTDGIAIVATNDLERGLQRVTADLSSYYLLAYYSTGKFDGKFHSISVRVKRPGVQVRARRGYMAPTTAEVAATTRAAPAPAAAAAAAEARALETVLMPLNGFGRDVPLRLQAVAGWGSSDRPTIAIVGEVGAGPDWKAGADADLMLLNAAGDTVATARAQVAPGARAFRVTLAPPDPLQAGEYSVRVRLRSRSPGAPPVNEALRLVVPGAPSAIGAVFSRKSAATGNRDTPTADLRFRRAEEVIVEWPTASTEPATARLLDRNGRSLPVPVMVTLRDDTDGTRWLVSRLALAPLGSGDYVIEIKRGTEISTDTSRTLVAFRVIP